jgi:hypothetical protein
MWTGPSAERANVVRAHGDVGDEGAIDARGTLDAHSRHSDVEG